MPDIISILNSVAGINDRRRGLGQVDTQLTQAARRIDQDDERIRMAERQFEEQVRQFKETLTRQDARIEQTNRTLDLSESQFEEQQKRADQNLDLTLAQLASQGRIKRKESLAIDTPAIVNDAGVSIPGSSFEVAPPEGIEGFDVVDPTQRLQNNLEALEGMVGEKDLTPEQRLQMSAVMSGIQNPHFPVTSQGSSNLQDINLLLAMLVNQGLQRGEAPEQLLQKVEEIRNPQSPRVAPQSERIAKVTATLSDLISPGQSQSPGDLLNALQQNANVRAQARDIIGEEDLQLWIGTVLQERAKENPIDRFTDEIIRDALQGRNTPNGQ